MRVRPLFAAMMGLSAYLPAPALAWGDEGHQIVALIAQQLLTPDVRAKVVSILGSDTNPTTAQLTGSDTASAATWADKYRDANIDGAKQRTGNWHYVDIEISAPDIDQACFGHPAAPQGRASAGPAKDCVVDKITQFVKELGDSATDPAERLMALRFVLHLVGDLHQPLHASDDHDRGGNDKHVSAPGIHSGTLHHYWDTEFVARIGSDAPAVASELLTKITDQDRAKWGQGSPKDWAPEAFVVARDVAYGGLPPPSGSTYQLTTEYVEKATGAVSMQLSRAGVRLASILNSALP